jgi:hypothetical protein
LTGLDILADLFAQVQRGVRLSQVQGTHFSSRLLLLLLLLLFLMLLLLLLK